MKNFNHIDDKHVTDNGKHRRKAGRHYQICWRKAALLVIVFLVLVTVGSSIVNAAAAPSQEKERTYATISIKSGDTLWDIASQYANNNHMSVNDYMKELIQINQLPTTQINYGQKLIVFYCE